MNKSSLATAVGLALSAANLGVQAALTSPAVLQFNTGVMTCVLNDCGNYGSDVTAGSWFAFDENKNNIIDSNEKWAIAAPHNGIQIGFVSSASGSHTGLPFGAANNYTGTSYVQIGANDYLTDSSGNKVVLTTTEHPGVDEPWNFFGNTGMHYLTSPVTVVQDNGTEKYLDFSGWGLTWNGIPAIPEGSNAWGNGTSFFNGGNGVARILCSTSSCSQTSTFTLNYYASAPRTDPSGFGGYGYRLHLEGQIAAAVVPVPAAAWLFGSGLLGLVAAVRRRK